MWEADLKYSSKSPHLFEKMAGQKLCTSDETRGVSFTLRLICWLRLITNHNQQQKKDRRRQLILKAVYRPTMVYYLYCHPGIRKRSISRINFDFIWFLSYLPRAAAPLFCVTTDSRCLTRDLMWGNNRVVRHNRMMGHSNIRHSYSQNGDHFTVTRFLLSMLAAQRQCCYLLLL